MLHLKRFRFWVQVAILAPWALSTAVAGMFWHLLFAGTPGIFIGLFQGVPVLADWLSLSGTSGAWFALGTCEVWKTSSFIAFLAYAGLQQVPKNIYEAARLDGAGVWVQFWHITLPLLKPALVVAVMFRLLDALRIFDVVYLITSGGPGNATETVSLLIFKVGIQFLEFSRGAAFSLIYLLVLSLVSLVLMKYYQRTRRAAGWSNE